MGRHIEKKENPQNFFFSNDTHTHKKEEEKPFFLFLRVYVLCLAHIFTWDADYGDRWYGQHAQSDAAAVQVLFISFLWFWMLEFRPFEQQVWGGPFFSKCYSSTMSLLICAWEGVAPPSRDCWRINIFSRRNLTVRNWCTFTCSSLTASHTAEMSLLAFHLVFSIHFIRLNFEFWSLHSRLNVNKQVQCYIWLHTPLNLCCGIRTK